MQRSLLVLALVLSLAGCDKMGEVFELMEVSEAVETELQNLHGLTTKVIFNKVNGRLKTVSVVLDQKEVADLTIAEIVVMVQPTIHRHFKETPPMLSISIVIRK